MKKIDTRKLRRLLLFTLMTFLFTILTFLSIPAIALAEAVGENPMTIGYDWASLAGVAGATAFTLLVVQFIKAPLDRIWHIPTRAVVYLIAFATLLVAQVFTAGFSVDALVLTAVNAVIVSSAAMGAYELTFAKAEKSD